MSAPARYAEWLAHLFERADEHDENLSPEARIALADAQIWRGEPAETAALWVHMLRHARTDLAHYDEEQLARGIKHATDNSFSNIVFDLRAKTLPEPLRSDAILEIIHLYADVFAPRCAPALGHLDEDGANALNRVCYMFWDVSPLASASPTLTLPLFEKILRLPNPACQESALHGLGHMQRNAQTQERIAAIFAAYRPAHGALRAYAERAAAGRIL